MFATAGVDAPVRNIAQKAGVGLGTLYRHFPHRSDLIAAVFRREIDVCADAAPMLSAERQPFEALADWMQRYAAFIGANAAWQKLCTRAIQHSTACQAISTSGSGRRFARFSKLR